MIRVSTALQFRYFKERLIEIFEESIDKNLPWTLFQEYWISRDEWALVLRCDRTAFWRWEKRIIRLVFSILADYRKCEFLDNYQRFILAIISAQRRGLIDGKKRRYAEIKDYLRTIAPEITRDKFNNWVERCSQEKS